MEDHQLFDFLLSACEDQQPTLWAYGHIYIFRGQIVQQAKNSRHTRTLAVYKVRVSTMIVAVDFGVRVSDCVDVLLPKVLRRCVYIARPVRTFLSTTCR